MDDLGLNGVNFGSSQFKGKEGLEFDLKRGTIQLIALIIKNFLILFRKPFQLLLFLLLPSCVFLAFLIQVHDSDNNNSNSNPLYPSIPIENLGACDVYESENCIRVVYGPENVKNHAIMNEFSTLTDLTYGKDVIGFDTVDMAQEFVATHIGQVQFTILFQNKSLWETSAYSPSLVPLSKDLAYTIFYNETRNHDSRSKKYNINFPLLVAQKALEESFLRLKYGSNFLRYDVDYGQLWNYPYMGSSEEPVIENVTAVNITKCDLSERDRSLAVGITLPWVLVFVMLALSSISFQIVADERRKQLFTFLRRLGLYDTSYWLSWFITFQILLVIACTLSLITYALVIPHSDILRAIDSQVMFLVLYLSASGTISLSFFLASFCHSSSISSSLSFTQFLIALVIVVACINPFNSYTYPDTDDDGTVECYLETSSYNRIYSPQLPGASFVQFLVFFLPYFHSAQAISDIISIARYHHLEVSLSDLGSPKELVEAGSTNTYDSMWIGYSLRLLAIDAVFYLFCSWLASQLLSTGASEGRPLQSVLIPPFLRRYLKSTEDGALLQDGDIRGEEKEKSRTDKSVRAYKVSKTYSGVQALKEVSFTMKKGEVFVLLGHNGAGKSTLINIITGVTKPTHGKVYLNGFDIEEDIAEIQQTIGVCSQDDFLWDELTAKEHMLLTAIFKGIKWGPDLHNAVESVLNLVQLQDRSSEFCRQYSGGMKRRLSVAMSTVGDVEILFLDEPTTGLDPVSRRRVWEAINIMKKNRVVVLTTHNMEEADYLADTIMIMHSGHVRAFGDPLFLKQTFGKGYQVNIQLHKEYYGEAHEMIMSILPDATCLYDENSLIMTVTVPKINVIGLPRLFTWLESSRRAQIIVKEWGVSNTTLEQVFLLLCIQNTEINLGMAPNTSEGDRNQRKENLCPMCNIRPREHVVLRNMNQEMIVIPNSICWECSVNNSHYKLSMIRDGEELKDGTTETMSIDQLKEQNLIEYLIKEENNQRQLELQKLIQKAQIRAENALSKQILEKERERIAEEEVNFNDSAWNEETSRLLENSSATPEAISSPMLLQDDLPTKHIRGDIESGQHTAQRTPKKDEWGGSTTSQIHAIMMKNVVLQSRQRCSNICSVFLVVALFGVLYLIGFLFGLNSVDQCHDGYLSDNDCSLQTVVDHIFSGSDHNMADDDWWDDDDDVGPYGYNIKNYLVPSQSYVQVFGSTSGIYYYTGWYYYYARTISIWSSFESESVLQYGDHQLTYTTRSLPNNTNSSVNEPNTVMYQNQELNYQSSLMNVNYPECTNEEYTENILYGSDTTSRYEIQQTYSNLYADIVIACLECPEYYTDSSPDVIYFNGTLWLSRVSGTNSDCDKQSCKRYPYGYINYKSSSMSPTANYFNNPDCPAGIDVMDMNSYPYYGKSQQIQVMTTLNYLTNTLVDPSLDNYTIQGGFSPYGDLQFDATSISQGESNILTVIAMFLINGFWPLAVWRLSHERTQDLVLMMRTVGMKTISYIMGMFLFDMAISVFSGIAMVVFAVVLNLSQFEGAPVGDLVAIVLLSSFALNALALLLVQLFGKKATILPLLAPCLCVVTTAVTSLLNVFLYPDDGDWPWALSLIPFLAQGRALYIILVYHQISNEVIVAYVLLILFGIVSLTIVYILEAEIPVFITITIAIKRLLETPEEKEFRRNSISLEANEPPPDLTVVETAGDLSPGKKVYKTFDGSPMDDDVVHEKLNALQYLPTTHDLSPQDKFAIVIQNLRHIFPNGTVAVKELSLALSYGECFGLLGPNGTGKSTTISILSGTLRASFGQVFIAGCDIEKDTSAIHRYVGICPQFDVVWKDLTVAEHLTFQARQRGIPAHRLSAEVQKAALSVGLDGDGFYTKAGDLSGGMRRRLSIAMSVVGNPPIIFMDEPTTGLDPDNKNHVWSIIQSLKSPSRLILMTTHSMEEAEALCSRIGIMARGELQCIGTSSHLKKKYGKGYTLTINLLKYSPPLPPTVPSSLTISSSQLLDKNSSQYLEEERQYDRQTDQQLCDYVINQLSLGHGKLISSINRTKKFLIPKLIPRQQLGEGERIMNISEIFKEMETHRNELCIREWGLSMATLEDVFISAVRNPAEELDMEFDHGQGQTQSMESEKIRENEKNEKQPSLTLREKKDEKKEKNPLLK